jgi:predicted nucleic acid-binding protein
MPDYILDASLTLAWCFEDERTAFTDTVQEELRTGSTCLVPPIWPSEVANGILMAERRGRISIAESEAFLLLLLQLPIRVASLSSVHIFRDVLRLARDHGLTVHDASYLALALREGLPLATLDGLLRTAARQIGIALQ